jgi:hypothetical protein
MARSARASDLVWRAPRDYQLGRIDPVGNVVHWHMDGAQSGADERLYPGAATLEAFDADLGRTQRRPACGDAIRDERDGRR